MAAATATPGIRFTTGQSLSDLSALARELGAIRKQLQGIRQDAQQAASGLNGLNGGLVNRHGQPLRQPEPEAPKPARQGRQQKVPAANADRNLFAGMTGNAGMTDAEWRELGKKQAKRREEALKAGMELNPTERREFARTRGVVSSIRARTGEDMQGMLARAVNFAGWSPFMPQNMYLAQMALGEMGLGLGLPAVAAGMGVLGLGAAGLGLNAYGVNQMRTGQQLVSAVGTNGPFAANAYTTAADEAQLLQQRAGQLHLTTDQAQQAVSGLAAGGLSGNDAFGLALSNTAELINVFGMSVQDATTYVTTLRTNLGMTDQQVNQSLANLAQTALATGIPLSSLGQILEQTPNALTNLANSSQYGPAAAVARAIGGTTQGGEQVFSVMNAAGRQALSIASQMHLSDQQFNALQGTAAGQKQIGDFIVGLVQQSMQQSGGAVDQAMLVVNGRLGTNFTKAQIERMANLSPNATTQALNQAFQAPSAAAVGSASQAIAQAAAGNPAAASATANPWNIKDMTVNAAQVLLTGAVSQAGTIGDLLSNGGAFSTAQLQQIAQQGGARGLAAQGLLAARAPAAGAAMTDQQLRAVEQQGGLAGALARVMDFINAVGASATGGASTTIRNGGGGGGGGQVITLDVRTDGARVATLPVQIGPNQQAQQYIPLRYHAPGRGPR